jgi:hypothetical protein
MKMQYTIRDTARPDDQLLIDLTVDEDDDPDGFEPRISGRRITELLDWWSDPKGRGYLELEDGGYIVVVDAASGEPTIEPWSEIENGQWELESFPFPTLSFEVTQ